MPKFALIACDLSHSDYNNSDQSEHTETFCNNVQQV